MRLLRTFLLVVLPLSAVFGAALSPALAGRAGASAFALRATAAAANREPDLRRIGDYYASCTDEAAIEAKGLTTLQPALQRIQAMRNWSRWTANWPSPIPIRRAATG